MKGLNHEPQPATNGTAPAHDSRRYLIMGATVFGSAMATLVAITCWVGFYVALNPPANKARDIISWLALMSAAIAIPTSAGCADMLIAGSSGTVMALLFIYTCYYWFKCTIRHNLGSRRKQRAV